MRDLNHTNMIREFNRVRNNFKLDMKLEMDMLKEEIREYFDATTLADRVDAYIDLKYVWQGTRMKCAYNGFRVAPDVLQWINETLELMEDDLASELGTRFGHITDKAFDIVCNINALKTKDLDENGKVIKPENLPNATEVINKLLKDNGCL